MAPFYHTQAQKDKSEHGFRLGPQVNVGANSDMWMAGEMVSGTKPFFGGGLEIGYRFNRCISVYTGMGLNRYVGIPAIGRFPYILGIIRY